MKYFLYFLSIGLLFSSCSEAKDDKLKINIKLEKLYNNKLNKLNQNPQFIIDKLEILFFKKGLNNNEATELINKLPKKYKKIRLVYSILFSIEYSKDIKLNRGLLTLLLKFQESNNVLKFIAENYYKAESSLSEKAFYTLYALGYNFSDEDYKHYLANDKLSDFILLNFLSPKKDYCDNDTCSKDIKDRVKFINNINQQIYTADTSNLKLNKKLYKNSFKKIKKLKKEIRKIARKNRKLKKRKKLQPENEEQLKNKIEELNFYKKELIPVLKTYLYFYAKERKLSRTINKLDIASKLLINNTKINKKTFYFVHSTVKNKPYPIKLTFYKYLSSLELKLSKRDTKKIKYLKYSKKYHLLKYGFFKKHFPELFKKLSIKLYLRSRFIFVLIKDFDWYFLENLRKDKKNIKNLLYFQYAPQLIKDQKDKLFKLYTTDAIENIKIAGNESYIYTLLKIFLKADIKLTKEQIEILAPVKIIYIQEILKHFK